MILKKYRIGYTTGVFDLFHVGHLNILMKSKELCDYLIVGVSTDELVKEYKNKTPIIPFEERMRMVESVKYVDRVVPQITMDKLEAWKQLSFDVVFHGDDWKSSEMYKKTEIEFKELGIDMVYFPYTIGTSSTKIREILEAYRI